MSYIIYTADGQQNTIRNKVYEGMTNTQRMTTPVNVSTSVTAPVSTPVSNLNSSSGRALLPGDFLNLAGNLKLAGSVQATNFYKEDGTELNYVTKLAFPDDIYYTNKNLGIGVKQPCSKLDVAGTVKISNNNKKTTLSVESINDAKIRLKSNNDRMKNLYLVNKDGNYKLVGNDQNEIFGINRNGDVIIKGNIIFQGPNQSQVKMGMTNENSFAINNNKSGNGLIIDNDDLKYIKNNTQIRLLTQMQRQISQVNRQYGIPTARFPQATQATQATRFPQATQAARFPQATQATQAAPATQATQAARATQSAPATQAARATQATQATPATQSSQATQSAPATQYSRATRADRVAQATRTTYINGFNNILKKIIDLENLSKRQIKKTKTEAYKNKKGKWSTRKVTYYENRGLTKTEKIKLNNYNKRRDEVRVLLRTVGVVL